MAAHVTAHKLTRFNFDNFQSYQIPRFDFTGLKREKRLQFNQGLLEITEDYRRLLEIIIRVVFPTG